MYRIVARNIPVFPALTYTKKKPPTAGVGSISMGKNIFPHS